VNARPLDDAAVLIQAAEEGRRSDKLENLLWGLYDNIANQFDFLKTQKTGDTYIAAG
jgi:hypothetical protein